MMMSMGVYGRDRNNNEFSMNLSEFNQLGYGLPEENYALIYLHLSPSVQEKVDLDFAKALMTQDFSSKTIEEVIEIIDLIRFEIIKDLELDVVIQRYGMMGGSMMGYKRIRTASCVYLDNELTFEWLYVHSSSTQRQNLDLLFAQGVLLIELDSLNEVEVMETIYEIKLDIIQQMMNFN
jgi:hypothetical protein